MSVWRIQALPHLLAQGFLLQQVLLPALPGPRKASLWLGVEPARYGPRAGQNL
ncbi:hypothetical protein AG1IA_00918 [Rhizoctonia solani AG-1 IA]|uniref:Uncharacterized protein n=1 Tax=Thanatephorus cucumeris (strain AG1-IA) TaxID=983506 RepID=L8X417_THACA|nr:hypothetical protein AG1IA_00918 [Rhizoctonia solani AG-1 IA]